MSLPNPDELTKTDMVNIIHDLTYQIKGVLNEKDLISALEKKHGVSLIELDEQKLLYYVYLFCFIVYTTQFLTEVDYKAFLRGDKLQELQSLVNGAPTKNNLINFIVLFLSIFPKGEHKSSGWGWSIVKAILVIMLMLALIPVSAVPNMLLKQYQGGKVTGVYGREGDRNLTAPQGLIKEYPFQYQKDKAFYKTGTVTDVVKDPLSTAIKENDLDKVRWALDEGLYYNLYEYIKQAIEQHKDDVLSVLLFQKGEKLSNEQYADLIKTLLAHNSYPLSLFVEDAIGIMYRAGAKDAKNVDWRDYFRKYKLEELEEDKVYQPDYILGEAKFQEKEKLDKVEGLVKVEDKYYYAEEPMKRRIL